MTATIVVYRRLNDEEKYLFHRVTSMNLIISFHKGLPLSHNPSHI